MNDDQFEKLIKDFDTVELTKVTDEDILRLCNYKFVTKPEDFNLRKGPRSSDGYLKPVPGGLYDGRIFGSIYEHRCNCGAITEPNIPCMECGTMVLDNIERYTRYGAIDVGIYFTTNIKAPMLFELIRKNFRVRIAFKDEVFGNDRFDLNRDYKILTILYFAQFSYDEESKSIILSDTIDDISMVGLEGLLRIVDEHKPELKDELMKYMNRYVPVYPAIMRKVKFCIINGKKSLKLPKSTAYYRSLLIAVGKTMDHARKSQDLYSVAAHFACLRLYAAQICYKMSGFLKSSKESFPRNTYTINSAHSGRAVIAGDPKLPIDTIKIPRVLAYEMYKKQFLKYMMEVEAVESKNLARLYNDPTEEVWEMFDRFIKDKAVIINRAPTLHAQNIQCYKLQVSDDYVIHFPLLTTAAQNADFDGDAVMFYAVPDEFKDYMLERCNPSNYTVYPTDDAPILKARHEILYGLTIATKLIDSGEDHQFVNLKDMITAYSNDEIWVYDKIMLGDMVTSYGRAKVAYILGIHDLDEIIGSDPINAKNLVEIYKIINTRSPEDRVKILQQLQEFALEVVTLEGATSINLKELYYDVPDEYKNRINELLDSDIPEVDKIREAEEIHNQMMEDMIKNPSGISKDTVNRINEGNRGKMSAIVDMLVPAFNVDAKGRLQFSEHSLVEGLTEKEYLAHSASNRELLITKANMVPFSGFLTRQLKESGSKIVMIKGATDPDNEGLEIPMYMAEGRTTVDGKIVPKSNSKEMVRVRSMLTTKLNYVTEDMFSNLRKFTYDTDGRCYIGTDWMTAFSADITQSGLSLKHGGVARYVLDLDKLIAPCDTDVEYTEDTIILKATGEVYIKPTRWSTRGNGFYKKGQVIGEVPNYVTFSHTVESLVKIFKGSGNLNYRDMMNDIKFTDCFNHATEGKLTYDGKKIRVGKMSWKRDSRFVKHPIGSMIDPYQRICSGTQAMTSLNGSRLSTRFNIFRNQILELRNVTEEILEMIFSILTDGGHDFQGLNKMNTTNNDSALGAIGYGYSGKAVTRITKGDLKVNTSDPMTEMIMTPMFWRIIESLKDKENNSK